MSKGPNLKQGLEGDMGLGRDVGNSVGGTASSVANLLASHGNLRGNNVAESPALDSLSNVGSSNISPGAVNSKVFDGGTSNLDNLINNLRGDDSSTGESFMNMVNPTKTGNLRGASFINASQASFILGIISNWYLLVAIPAMTVTYNVFKSLKDQGILDSLYSQVSFVLKDIIKLSSECPQLIYDIGKFTQCLGW